MQKENRWRPSKWTPIHMHGLRYFPGWFDFEQITTALTETVFVAISICSELSAHPVSLMHAGAC